MTVRLEVKVANIGRNVPAPKTRANLSRMKRRPLGFRKWPHAVLWQEIDDDDAPAERAMLNDLWRPSRFRTWPTANHPGCHVPVTLPAPWTITKHSGVTKVSDGIAKITPDRYVTKVIATHPDLTDPVAFVSFQLVAGAWTTPGQAREADRQNLWHGGWAGAKAVINDAALDGLTTFYGADTNNPRPPSLHPRDHRVVHHGLDVLGYIPGSVDVKVRGKGVIDLDIDGHDGLFGRFLLSNA